MSCKRDEERHRVTYSDTIMSLNVSRFDLFLGGSGVRSWRLQQRLWGQVLQSHVAPWFRRGTGPVEEAPGLWGHGAMGLWGQVLQSHIAPWFRRGTGPVERA